MDYARFVLFFKKLKSTIKEDKGIEIKSFNWSNDDFPFDEEVLKEVNKTIRIIAYNKIKANGFFSDAKDV